MKKWIYNALLILFALVFVVSGGLLARYYIDAHNQSSRYEDLSSLHDVQLTPRPAPTVPSSDAQTQPTEPALVEVTDPDTGETLQILPEFAALYKLNSDIVGWLKIPGTVIDYPVMQTPDSPDYYLERNFDRENNSHGCIYAREQCDVFAPSDNVTLYGHHMRDGSMFAQLDKYRDPQFRQENPYIYFDTLTQLRTYEVMAVFVTTASIGEGFYYHAFVDAQTPEEFDQFVHQCQALSLYDTGVTAGYGDKLICLSTCEYSQTNGRLVVVAKQIA